ncbi:MULTISPECIES: hypothetical protein [unclassified Apibacter]|uniref:hypothetical protein n=1 Tax=unclassified Apibacter TaxID=2630820 RepID=UPI001C86B0F2|nr:MULTISPECIES: hypothetical protein [unclassified Apibacter]MCX8676248.1 hypothetical protein [Apibacter sp. B3919]
MNGKVYRLRNLDTIIKEPDFTVLPTPTKSDALIILQSSLSYQIVLLKKLSRQNPISVPIKRFNGKSSYEFLRMDDGFSKELDKRRISSLGNAVIPEIAHYLFECIKKFEFKN